MGELKTSEVVIKLVDGTEQTFKLKELSWYEMSILYDAYTLLKYQEMSIVEPKMTEDIWKNMSRAEGEKLLAAIQELNRREDKKKI